MNRKMIINADDAGICPCVNEAILLGAEAGVITAAGIMPNMPFADHAVTLFREKKCSLDLGLHFCLTSGRPVSPPDEIPLLVNEQGFFRHGFVKLWMQTKLSRRQTFLEQVKHELEAQLNWLEKLGIPLLFLDSHQHIHMIPGIFERVAELARSRHLFLRIPDEKIGGFSRLFRRFPAWATGSMAKKALLSWFTQKAKRREVKPQGCRGFREDCTDLQYHGVLDTGKFLFPAWKALLQSPDSDSGPNKVRLINIHPALEDSQNIHPSELCCSSADLVFLRSPHRFGELEAVLSREFQELCQKQQFQIVGFHDMSG